MRHFSHLFFPALISLLLVVKAAATDVFFDDTSGVSPSGQYKVIARSPENEGEERRAFQASFVYTCTDTTTKKVLWTRAQPMSEAEKDDKGVITSEPFPEEGSPAAIFPSDNGWTVIWTGWNELISIDPKGRSRAKADLLEDGFSKKENKDYVQHTTAGPMWSAFSNWYYLDVGNQQFFVIRPWWGRRIFFQPETGKFVSPTDEMSTQALAFEIQQVVKILSEGVKNRKRWEAEDCSETIFKLKRSALIAGQLRIKEAIPPLEQLQDVPYVGSSTLGGISFGESFKGEVDPHSYRTFTFRQVVHLSLRRLGRTPRPLPCNQFDVRHEDYEKDRPYERRPSTTPRAGNVSRIKKGMKAEQVIDLIGEPDFVGYDSWEYDMDSEEPFTLVLTWDVKTVTKIKKISPALWKDGLTRDQHLAH